MTNKSNPKCIDVIKINFISYTYKLKSSTTPMRYIFEYYAIPKHSKYHAISKAMLCEFH